MKSKFESQKLRAEAIASLEDHPGWLGFLEVVEELIETKMPTQTSFKESEATEIASRIVHVNGLREVTQIIQAQKDLAKGK